MQRTYIQQCPVTTKMYIIMDGPDELKSGDCIKMELMLSLVSGDGNDDIMNKNYIEKKKEIIIIKNI